MKDAIQITCDFCGASQDWDAVTGMQTNYVRLRFAGVDFSVPVTETQLQVFIEAATTRQPPEVPDDEPADNPEYVTAVEEIGDRVFGGDLDSDEATGPPLVATFDTSMLEDPTEDRHAAIRARAQQTPSRKKQIAALRSPVQIQMWKNRMTQHGIPPDKQDAALQDILEATAMKRMTMMRKHMEPAKIRSVQADEKGNPQVPQRKAGAAVEINQPVVRMNAVSSTTETGNDFEQG